MPQLFASLPKSVSKGYIRAMHTATVTRRKKKNVPTYREAKVIDAIVSRRAKTLSGAMVDAGFNPGSQTVRDRFKEGGDLRKELDKQLRDAGLTLPRIMKRLSHHIESKKFVMLGKEASEVDDNESQLRAIDMSIKLHDRAGTIPSQHDTMETGSKIQVNIVIASDTTRDTPIARVASQHSLNNLPANKDNHKDNSKEE